MKHFRQILYINIGVFSMLLMFAGCQNSPQNQQADNVVRKDTMKTVAKMDSEMQLEMERAVILDYLQNIFRVVNDDQRTITGFVNSGLCDRIGTNILNQQLLFQILEQADQVHQTEGVSYRHPLL